VLHREVTRHVKVITCLLHL